MINYTKKSEDCYEVIAPNGTKIGDLIQKGNGFFAWLASPPRDYLEAWMLRNIANKLDEINDPWKRNLDEYFNRKGTN